MSVFKRAHGSLRHWRREYRTRMHKVKRAQSMLNTQWVPEYPEDQLMKEQNLAFQQAMLDLSVRGIAKTLKLLNQGR